MKYIRTEGGIYEFEKRSDDQFYLRLDDCLGFVVVLKEGEYTEADTIKELCDVFVYAKCDYMELEEALREKEWQEAECEQDESPLYGAIWTKCGLIYVAKLNEKGVLELL